MISNYWDTITGGGSFRLGAALAFVASITATNNSLADQPLEILAVHFPPYEFENPTNGLKGFDVEVVEEVFQRMGRKAKVVFRPWARAKRMVLDGGGFALLSCGQRKDRDKYLYYSSPISHGTWGYFHHKDFKARLPANVDELRGHTVVVVRDYNQHKELVERGIENYPVNSDATAVKLVAKGRFDFSYIPKEAAAYAAKNSGILHEVRYKTFRKKDFHLCVSRKWPNAKELVMRFNEGLEALKEDGTYAAIHAKYGSQDLGS